MIFLVIARAESPWRSTVNSVSEPHLSVRVHRMQWIAASVTSFSPRNDNELGVPNRLSHNSRSCHREG